jgi:hypothetical protein
MNESNAELLKDIESFQISIPDLLDKYNWTGDQDYGRLYRFRRNYLKKIGAPLNRGDVRPPGQAPTEAVRAWRKATGRPDPAWIVDEEQLDKARGAIYDWAQEQAHRPLPSDEQWNRMLNVLDNINGNLVRIANSLDK